MNTLTRKSPWTGSTRMDGPSFVFHPSFEEPDAGARYGGAPAGYDESLGFMPDAATQDLAKRMHYAAWRVSQSTTPREQGRWRRIYQEHRDSIVMGNHKLTYRAVKKWAARPQLADDLVGECQIVLIKAVVVYNPWLGVRFSTYVFTCLMRTLSRLSRRQAADRLSNSLPIELLSRAEPSYDNHEQPSTLSWVGEYLREEDPLLTSREKLVLTRRFQLNEESKEAQTLEQVGSALGLSKERVRQVQMSALGKLRTALLAVKQTS